MRTFIATTENNTQYWVEKNPYEDLKYESSYGAGMFIRHEENKLRLTNIGSRVPEGTEVREEELEINEQVLDPSQHKWVYPNHMTISYFKSLGYKTRKVATLKAKAEHCIESIEHLSEDNLPNFCEEYAKAEPEQIIEEYCKLCFERGGVKRTSCNSCYADEMKFIRQGLENARVSPLKDREQPWISTLENPLTQDTGEVIAFHPDWIHEDFNPNGTRIGFIGSEGTFISAFWWDYQDSYIEKDDVMPIHYMIIPSTKSLR